MFSKFFSAKVKEGFLRKAGKLHFRKVFRIVFKNKIDKVSRKVVRAVL